MAVFASAPQVTTLAQNTPSTALYTNVPVPVPFSVPNAPISCPHGQNTQVSLGQTARLVAIWNNQAAGASNIHFRLDGQAAGTGCPTIAPGGMVRFDNVSVSAVNIWVDGTTDLWCNNPSIAGIWILAGS
jgi:hypothetical protein